PAERGGVPNPLLYIGAGNGAPADPSPHRNQGIGKVSMERTLFIVKPDGVQRGLVGPILARLETRGLKIVGLKLARIDEALARRHYGEHEGKPFFAGLIEYITSAPVVL